MKYLQVDKLLSEKEHRSRGCVEICAASFFLSEIAAEGSRVIQIL